MSNILTDYIKRTALARGVTVKIIDLLAKRAFISCMSPSPPPPLPPLDRLTSLLTPAGPEASSGYTRGEHRALESHQGSHSWFADFAPPKWPENVEVKQVQKDFALGVFK